MPVTPTVAPGARDSGTLDVKRQERRGTSLSPAGRIWFTISHGILNEVYYPRVDSACTRDLVLIVTGPDGYFSEEKTPCHARHRTVRGTVCPPTGWSTPRSTAPTGSKKRILADPARPALLAEITFTALEGAPSDNRVYALQAPHLVNAGMGNTAWVGDHKGKPVLFASDAASAWRWPRRCMATARRYVGFSDAGSNSIMPASLTRLANARRTANVALTGEIGFSGAKTGLCCSWLWRDPRRRLLKMPSPA